MQRCFQRIFPKRLCPRGRWPCCSVITRRPIGSRERTWCVNPFLFLKSLRAKEEATEAKSLKEGLEGKWLRDLRVITHMLRGLLREVPTLFYSGQSNLDRRILLTAFEESQKQFMKLEKQIRRYDRDDHPGDQASHFESLISGEFRSGRSAKSLRLSRNTIRRVIRGKWQERPQRQSPYEELSPIIREVFRTLQGQCRQGPRDPRERIRP